MHHKNNRYSSSNHNNPQHQKPQYPTKPAPQSGPKKSVLNRIREKFQEKPATREEVQQLGLNAKREIYKTQIQKAKSSRPSKWDNIMGGGGGRQPSYRRGSSRAAPETGSWLLGSNNSGGGFLSSEKTPSLNFITGADDRPTRSRKQESGFGKGLTDLF